MNNVLTLGAMFFALIGVMTLAVAINDWISSRFGGR